MNSMVGSNEWIEYLQHASPMVLGVLYLLIGLSFLTWYLIAYKILELRRVERANRAYAAEFWEEKAIPVSEGKNQALAGPYSTLAQRGLAALDHFRKHEEVYLRGSGSLPETLSHALRQGIQDVMTRLESGLGILATIGNTAPFIGLFGTVIGIMSALKGISRTGAAGLDVVAGPIGEALIATAAGLACAIPAVMGYNSFVRRLRVMGNAMDQFAHDVFVRILAESRTRDPQEIGVEE